jgi:hypothetical protein
VNRELGIYILLENNRPIFNRMQLDCLALFVWSVQFVLHYLLFRKQNLLKMKHERGDVSVYTFNHRNYSKGL